MATSRKLQNINTKHKSLILTKTLSYYIQCWLFGKMAKTKNVAYTGRSTHKRTGYFFITSPDKVIFQYFGSKLSQNTSVTNQY